MTTDDDLNLVRPWTVLSSKITYEDRWLRIRSDHCLTASGQHVTPYHVIEYPDWVNVVALTRHDLRLVLVREYRHGRGEVLPGLVSGTIETADAGESDASAEVAARRELQEETGYRNGRFIRLFTSYPNPANHNNAVTSFLALDVEAGGEQSLDQTEAVELFLDDLPTVLMKLRSDELRMQAMHVAAIWSAAARILVADEAVGAAAPLRERLLAAIASPALASLPMAGQALAR